MNYTTVTEFILHVSSDNMDSLMGDYSGADILSRQEQILNQAEGMVDSYASVRWTTPLYASITVTSSGIKKSVLNIAQFLLYVQIEGDDVPERVKVAYLAEIEWLTKLAEGKIFPPPGTDGVLSSVRTGGSSIDIDSDTAVFDYDNMKVF